jgi:hypothetical protein
MKGTGPDDMDSIKACKGGPAFSSHAVLLLMIQVTKFSIALGKDSYSLLQVLLPTFWSAGALKRGA